MFLNWMGSHDATSWAKRTLSSGCGISAGTCYFFDATIWSRRL